MQANPVASLRKASDRLRDKRVAGFPQKLNAGSS